MRSDTLSICLCFICLRADCSLQHTVFGRVSKGMDVVHAIEKCKAKDSKPISPIKIISIEVLK